MLSAGTVKGLLELDDRFTAKLEAVATNAHNKFKKISDSAKQSGADSLTGITQNFDQIENRLDQAGSKLRGAGMTMTAAFTVPIVAGLGFAAKSAIDFESTFAGVRKTVDGVTDSAGNITEFGQMVSDEFRKMATVMPASVEEINAVGEAAGALGVSKDHLIPFVNTMIKLGETTNLTADVAATSMARFTNVMQTPRESVENLASALVALGNDGASTEAEIMEMAQRIAGAGASVGMTEGDVLGLANALSSLGLEAQVGGSSIQKMIIDMASSVSSGGENLAQFANISRMTQQEFANLFKSNPGAAFAKFTEGLSKAQVEGEDLIAIVKSLGIEEVRLTSALLRMGNAGTIVADSMELGNRAMKENAALNREYEQRVKTMSAQLTIFWNKIKNVAIEFGFALLPVLQDLIEIAEPFLRWLGDAVKWFSALPGPIKLTMLAMAGVVAAIGPFLVGLGLMASGLSSLIGLTGSMVKGWKGLEAALIAANFKDPFSKEGVAAGKALNHYYRVNTVAVTALGIANSVAAASFKVFWAAATGPIGIAVAAIAALALGLRYLTGSWDFVVVPMKVAWVLLKELASLVGRALVDAIETGGDVLKWFAGLFDFSKAKEQLTELWNAFLTMNPAISMFIDLVSNIGNKIAGWFDFSQAKKELRDLGEIAKDAWVWMKLVAGGDVDVKMPNIPDRPAIGGAPLKMPGLPEGWNEAGGGQKYVKPLKDAAEAQEAAAKAAAKYAEEIKNLNEQLSGAAAIKDWEKTAKALPPLHRLGEEGLKKVAEAANKAMDAYVRQGVVAPEALRKIHQGVNALVLQGPEMQKILTDAAREAVSTMQTTFTEAQRAQVNEFSELMAAQLQARKEFSTKNQLLAMSEKEVAIFNIEAERQAAIDAITSRFGVQTAAYKLAKTEIDAYYNHHLDLVNETENTVIQRAKEAGFATRAEQIASAVSARTLYDQMSAAVGVYSDEAIAEAKRRAEALEREADGTAAAWKKTASVFGEIAGILDNISGRFIEVATMAARAGEAIATNLAEGDTFGAVVAGVTAVIGIFSKMVGWANEGKDAIDDFYASFVSSTGVAGVVGLREELTRLGSEGERLWNNLMRTSEGDLEAAKKNIAAIEQALEDLNDDIQRYNLTWMDHTNVQQGANATAMELAESYRRLRNAGYDNESVIRAMSEELNIFIGDAIRSGAEIPKALEGIITQLIEMGHLTEENARLMLGLGENTMPTLADITAAAERYGLELDELGPKVQQLRLTEAATQMAADWDLLISAGANVNTLFAKMGEDIQKMVDEALRTGRALPESMRPMLETLVKAGLLTDEAGLKLTDLTGITFEESLTDQIAKLVEALQSFVEVITRGAIPGLEQLGRQRVKIPFDFEYDGDGVPWTQTGPRPPGFKGGTGGLRDFGPSTLVELHGKENVQTEAQYNAEQQKNEILAAKLGSIEDLLRRQATTIQIAIRDGILQAQ